MTIEVRQISKTYEDGTRALDRVSLDIGYGTFGLLGPAGSGKTTLMQILATRLPPTTGDAALFDIPLSDRAAIREILGYLPACFDFYPQLTVRETLGYFALLKGVSARSRADELLEQVGLIDQRSARAAALPAWKRQRLGIAVALLNDPRLLIVDEPTAHLDPEGRVQMRDLITNLPGPRIVLLSTDIVDDIAQTAAYLAVVYKGTILFTGRPKELAQLAEGKVWTTELDVAELPGVQASHDVVSSVRELDHLKVRCIGPGGSAFFPAEPTVEDGYMALLKGW